MNVTKALKDFSKNKELFYLSLPAVIFIFIFKYIPMYGIILPFKDYRADLGLFKSKWSGFDNFKFLFNSYDAWRITRNTVLFNALFIVAGLFFAVLFALLLNEVSRRFVKLYQTIMFFPYFLSWVVASYVFLGLLDMEYGLLNSIIQFFGHEGLLWYNEPKYWPYILLFANLWKGVGYSAVIYYAGLMSIDIEYYEAAELDGASRLQQVRLISIPFLKPLIVMMTILSIGRIFNSDFGLFYNVTLDSSALYSVTDVIDTYVYRSLRRTGEIGMASAAGLYQSTVGFILVMLTNSIVKKINSENSLF